MFKKLQGECETQPAALFSRVFRKAASRLAAGVVLSAAGFGAAHAAPILYGIDDATDTIVAIDTTTGAVTTVGAINSPSGAYTNFSGLALDDNGVLYSGASNPFGIDGDMVRIDAATGAEISRTPLTSSPSGFGRALNGFAFGNDGTFYGIQGASADDLVSIDEPTGVHSFVVSLGAPITGGFIAVTDIAVAPDGTIYGFNGGQLISIDPVLGGTAIGDPLSVVGTLASLAFADDGTLFAVTTGIDDRLIQYDLTTNTIVSNIALGDGFTPGSANPLNITGIAYFSDANSGDPTDPTDPTDPPTDVSEPATGLLTLAGLLGLAGFARRRRAA